jgi:hypothetical protein
MTEEQEEAQKHGFMQPGNPNMADQTRAKCCNATPDPFEIATIYFISPPGFAAEAPMDSTWSTFVKHDQFWNLAHAPQKIPDPTPIEPITLQTGLVGGIADSIFSSLLAPGNDAYNTAIQVLRNRNLAGRFWTL